MLPFAEKLLATIKADSESRFANHISVKEAEGRYLCKQPGTIINSFRVVDLPGAVLIYGDIGELLLLRNGGLSWALGGVNSINYLLSKASHKDGLEEFYPRLAEECLADWVENEMISEAQKDDIVVAWDGETEDSWAQAIYDHTNDGELVDSARFWTHEALWCVEALKWFKDQPCLVTS